MSAKSDAARIVTTTTIPRPVFEFLEREAARLHLTVDELVEAIILEHYARYQEAAPAADRK